MSTHAKFFNIVFWFIVLSFLANGYELFIAHAYSIKIDWETINVLRGTYNAIYDISVLGILFLLIKNIADTKTQKLFLIGFLFFAIFLHASATPGVYARLRSCFVPICTFDLISSFPFFSS